MILKNARILSLSEDHEAILIDIGATLSPIALLIKKFSSDAFDYSQCDGILEFVWHKISNLNSPLAKELSSSLSRRVKERRNVKIATALMYLSGKRDFALFPDDSFLCYSTRGECIGFIKTEYDRLFGNSNPDSFEEESVTCRREGCQHHRQTVLQHG